MAAKLNVFHSVTHAPTFSDYSLMKEMGRAFEGIPADFRWAARRDALSASRGRIQCLTPYSLLTLCSGPLALGLLLARARRRPA